jgi:hypothetical protein
VELSGKLKMKTVIKQVERVLYDVEDVMVMRDDIVRLDRTQDIL